ncbi:MAG: MFS transporter, partial [Cellvibrionaceae bacterium]|nr:MFS transporter [Cellvibrionaceae bacterium]
HQRGTALAFYTAAIYVGIMVGYLVGGWVDENWGWRVAFFVVGIPGILVALLVRFTIDEPERGAQEVQAHKPDDSASLKETLATLKSMPSFVCLALGSGLASFSSYGVGNFMPSFLARSHGMESSDIGTLLAFGAGIGGGIGAFLAGWLADRIGRDNKRWYAWLAGIGQVAAIPLGLMALFADNMLLITLGIAGSTFFGIWYLGPILAVAQTLVKANMRATTSAVLFFVLNLIGLGGGPLAAGLLSDWLALNYGSESLRYALTIMTFSSLFAATAFILGSRYLLADLRKNN